MLSPSQKTLLTRAGSALIAVAVLVVLYMVWDAKGLQSLCYVAVALGSRELLRMLFKLDDSFRLKATFVGLIFMVFIVASHFPNDGGLAVALAATVFCSVSLLLEKRFESIETLLLAMAKSLLGFFYVGLAPSFAYRLFDLGFGMRWFIAMLIIVFTGDTLAYLTGMSIGKTKLMPSISPKKTLEGALGGLVGSVLAALLLSQWLTPAPLWYFAIMGACVGTVAQLGDLFESLLKRVANRKDSGTLMPGHGGVLDRLDGVLFAAPTTFFFVQIIERHIIS